MSADRILSLVRAGYLAQALEIAISLGGCRLYLCAVDAARRNLPQPLPPSAVDGRRISRINPDIGGRFAVMFFGSDRIFVGSSVAAAIDGEGRG